jgi:hypothetical protein
MKPRNENYSTAKKSNRDQIEEDKTTERMDLYLKIKEKQKGRRLIYCIDKLHFLEESLQKEYKYYKSRKDLKSFSAEILLQEAISHSLSQIGQHSPHLKPLISLTQKSLNSCLKGMKEYWVAKDRKFKEMEEKLKEMEGKYIEEGRRAKKREDMILKENRQLIDELKGNLKRQDELMRKWEELGKNGSKFMGKFDEQQILQEIREMINENDSIRDFAREIKSELDYGKQRENKLMYFLFVLQQKGYPVFDVFEKNIKNIATARFSTNLDEEYKNIYYHEQKNKFKRAKCKLGLMKTFDEQKMEKLSERVEQSLRSDESTLPLEIGKPLMISKPSKVPEINLDVILKRQKEEYLKGLNAFEQEMPNKFKKKPRSAKIDFEESKSEDGEGESDWDCSYWLALKKSELRETSIDHTRELSIDDFENHLSPEEREERNRRIEELLKISHSEKYKMIRDLNKMQELADSFHGKDK